MPSKNSERKAYNLRLRKATSSRSTWTRIPRRERNRSEASYADTSATSNHCRQFNNPTLLPSYETYDHWRFANSSWSASTWTRPYSVNQPSPPQPEHSELATGGTRSTSYTTRNE